MFELSAFNVTLTAIVCIALRTVARTLYRAYVFRGIPGIPFRPFASKQDVFGNVERFLELSSLYGPVWKFWNGLSIELVVSDLDLVGTIFNNTQDYDITHRPEIAIVIGTNLVTMRGQAHKRERKILNPAFHISKLQCMASIAISAAVNTLARCNRLAESGQIFHLAQFFGRTASEVICQASFGVDFECQEKSGSAILDFMANTANGIENNRKPRTMGTFIYNIFSGATYRAIKALRQFQKEVRRLIGLREAEIKNAKTPEEKQELLSKDLLGLLFLKKEEGELTFEQVLQESMAFLAAGYETTTTWLQFTIVMLCQHPKVEAQLIEELDRVIGERTPTWELIKQCNYLHNVLQECLRMHPPIPVVDRQTMRDVQLGKVHLPKGTGVFVPPIVIHNNPKFWDEPEMCKPERFENKTNFHNTLIPFSMGGRNCIGQHFAWMEAKIVLAHVLREYKFTLLPGQDLTRKSIVSMYFKDGVKVKVEHRKGE